MKRIIILLILSSSFIFSQNLYFSEPTSSHVDEIWSSGKGPIAYNMYVANGWVVNWWRAKLTYPNNSVTPWENGETGTWWVSEAGTYKIQGEADAVYWPTGQSKTLVRQPFSFSVIDNYAPATHKTFRQDGLVITRF